MTKQWYQSKTKVGGVLIGASMVLGSVGGALTGDVDLATAVTGIVTGCGVIFAACGIRDALD